MIKEVRLQNFKRYRDQVFTFRPDGITLLAGGNNSGKSTVLQALAVWEFCRALVEAAKGRRALNAGVRTDPAGVSNEEFSPIALPSLEHLWTNLDGKPMVADAEIDPTYTLRISVTWDVEAAVVEGQPQPPSVEHQLQFGLKLLHHHVYVKQTNSTLQDATPIPRFAYLPPFAGIQTREERMSPAAQKRLIGRGLAGAALRNVIHDLHRRSETEFANLRGARRRMSVVERQQFFRRDPWSQLVDVLQRVFQAGLAVQPFNDDYNTVLHVDLFRGNFQNGNFTRFANFTPRDIMVEGSGFLQWLSVYALAVSPEINILLLDEPDAHLHPTLQAHLLERLRALAVENRKQALLATHSTEILRQVDHRMIFEFSRNRTGYLVQSEQRVGLFHGLGSDYAPKLDQLRQHRRVIFVEGTFEEPILRIFAEKMGQPLPQNLVFWIYNGEHTQRRVLFEQLRTEIPNLKGMSLRDRDSLELAEVNANLTQNNYPDRNELRMRTWRRRQMDNYLLLPAAISRAANRQEADVTQFFADHWGLAVGANPTASNCSPGLLDARGKEILTEGLPARNLEPAKPSVESALGCSRHDVARHFEAAEVPEDVRLIVTQLHALCQP